MMAVQRLELDYDPFTYDAAGEIAGIKPLSEDPRCLYGWGPSTRQGCYHSRFGHGCSREFGHPGRCTDVNYQSDVRCSRVSRPADWDTRQRAECNR